MEDKQQPGKVFVADAKKAGDEWTNYIKQFPKLEEGWNQLSDVTRLWFAQQIDIFSGKYPASPLPASSSIEWQKKEWIVGDVFTTKFWGAPEVCMVYKIQDGYVYFIRFESIRGRDTLKKDYCLAGLKENEFKWMQKTFIHHSDWRYEYRTPLHSALTISKEDEQ